MIDTVLLDLRYALRALRRSPGFTALAIITLGLGIGAATAGFSLLNRLLLQPLPGVNDAGRLAYVTFMQPFTGTFAPPGSWTPASLNTAQRAQVVKSSPAVLGLSGWQGPMALNVGASGALAVRAQGAFVTGNYLQLLGVTAQRGRSLQDDDDIPPSGRNVAVISDRLWNELYGRRGDVVDSTILINGLPFTLVGILPPGFHGPDRVQLTDIWVPGNTYWDIEHSPGGGHAPMEIPYYRTITRLRQGATFEQAEAQLEGAVRALAATDSDEFSAKTKATVVPGVGLEHGGEAVRRELSFIMAVAGLVLLVACANIANLLLFRRSQRRSDVVVRLSLGAARGRLVRLFMTESALLGVAGGAAGVLIAVVLKTSFGAFKILRFIDVGPIPIDVRVVAFAVTLGVVAAVVAGVVPALVGTSVDLNADLKASGPNQAGGAPRLRLGLATLQIAISLTLVAGAYLFADTLRNYGRIPLGFDPAGITVFQTDPREVGYDQTRMGDYYAQMTARLDAIPGVSEVALVDAPPFWGGGFGLALRAGAESISVNTVHVSPGYFETLGIPIIRGTPFSVTDLWPDSVSANKKVILSATVARRVFGERDPIGQVVEFPNGKRSFRAAVVGVAGDVRRDFIGPFPNQIYQPVGAWPTDWSPTVLVKSIVPEASLVRQVKEGARGVDGSVTIESLGGLSTSVKAAISAQEVFFRVVSTLSLLTLLLTAVGVYGIVAYGVATRTREFGIRTALGAVPANLVQAALRPALIITFVGTLAGVGGALYLTRFIAASLYGVSRFDPLAFVLAALVLAVAVLLASWLPARRAAEIDPMVALRYE